MGEAPLHCIMIISALFDLGDRLISHDIFSIKGVGRKAPRGDRKLPGWLLRMSQLRLLAVRKHLTKYLARKH